jgi:hypothetical protein
VEPMSTGITAAAIVSLLTSKGLEKFGEKVGSAAVRQTRGMQVQFAQAVKKVINIQTVVGNIQM